MYSIELGDDNCLSRRSDALCVECGPEVQEGSARMPDGSSSKGGICLIECGHCPATAGQQWREPGAEGGDKGVKEDTRVIFKVATAETDGDGARVRRRQRSGRGNKRGISKSVVADSHTRGYQLCRHVIYADYQPKRSQTQLGRTSPSQKPVIGHQRTRMKGGRRPLAVFVSCLLAVSSALRNSILVRLPVLICFG